MRGDGAHRPPVAGIVRSAASGGAVSIVLSNRYPEDVDRGESFTYTGSSGEILVKDELVYKALIRS